MRRTSTSRPLTTRRTMASSWTMSTPGHSSGAGVLSCRLGTPRAVGAKAPQTSIPTCSTSLASRSLPPSTWMHQTPTLWTPGHPALAVAPGKLCHLPAATRRGVLRQGCRAAGDCAQHVLPLCQDAQAPARAAVRRRQHDHAVSRVRAYAARRPCSAYSRPRKQHGTHKDHKQLHACITQAPVVAQHAPPGTTTHATQRGTHHRTAPMHSTPRAP